MILHLIVAETWNFNGADGPNVINAQVIKTGGNDRGDKPFINTKTFKRSFEYFKERDWRKI